MTFKNTLLASAIMGLMIACGNQGTSNADQRTDDTVVSVADTVNSGKSGFIEFDEAAFDFGTVKEGTVVEHVFKFKNTGETPIILSQVSASCGCTTPDFTKEPVLPGKTGEIKVSFNSLGQVGTQQKIVTVSSNAQNRVTTVQIKGIVEK